MNDEYLATGFVNVDRAANIDAYASCLSLLDSLPYFKRYKQQTYELLKLGPGNRVLDAGCGLGDDVFRMAPRVLPGGQVVGLDASTKLIERAQADQRVTGLPVEFYSGDLSRLPFDDQSFTRCRIDRVLQHVAEPGKAISELVRLLKPGGILVAYDNDWGTFAVTSRNKAVTRIVENLWCDSFTTCWIGRHLQEYFIRAGLSEVTVYPSTSVISAYDTADKVYNLKQTVQRAVTKGRITKDQGIEWINELRQRSEAGYFAATLTAYTVQGKKR